MKNDLESEIREAFELLGSADLKPSRKAEILRLASFGRGGMRVRVFKFTLIPLLAAACLFAALLLSHSNEERGRAHGGLPELVVAESNRDRLVLQNGELRLKSDADWRWDERTETLIASVRAIEYFRGREGYDAVLVISKKANEECEDVEN